MRRRVIICLGLLLALCVIGDAIAMFCLHRSIHELTTLAESHRIQVMRANLASSGVRVETDLLANLAGHSHDSQRRMDSLRRFKESMNQCGACHHTTTVQARLDELRGTYESCVVAMDELFDVDYPHVAQDLERKAGEVIDRLIVQSTAMADQASYHVTLRSSDASHSVEQAWTILSGTLLVALLCGGFVALHLQRRLTRPVQALLNGIQRIRQGDLNHRLVLEGDREFCDLGEAFNQAYQSLKHAQEGVFQAEKMAAVGKLAAGVAHEVGNPLASISSVAQMMRRKGLPADQAERIDMIMEQIDRISRIVRELLTFSRSSPTELRVPVKVGELLDRSIALLRYDQRAARLRILADYDAGLREVRGNADKLLLVFTNIIINAFDALSTQSNGPPVLRITARQVGEDVWIRFEDNGPGITPEQLASVFEPFFTTKEPGSGTGLGLWICYQLVRQHQGTIQVEGAPGQGVTVTVGLPCEPQPGGPAPSPVVAGEQPGSTDADIAVHPGV